VSGLGREPALLGSGAALLAANDITYEPCWGHPPHNIRVRKMTAREFRRWLVKQGCTFESHKGGSGHLTVICGARRSQLPMHGRGKELGTGLIDKIKKDLGLD
jgi:mRNA interferase HicA